MVRIFDATQSVNPSPRLVEDIQNHKNNCKIFEDRLNIKIEEINDSIERLIDFDYLIQFF